MLKIVKTNDVKLNIKSKKNDLNVKLKQNSFYNKLFGNSRLRSFVGILTTSGIIAGIYFLFYSILQDSNALQEVNNLFPPVAPGYIYSYELKNTLTVNNDISTIDIGSLKINYLFNFLTHMM